MQINKLVISQNRTENFRLTEKNFKTN